ncbi:hypothetical protein RHGRI_028395 [Rhododendron griersonianum]|uniref:No apical meristem-associated C-terminal domain-containing protein n=1 Tax=Rhododendron griersonianum TaxID=479676 RepID=A0AAV6IG72_9ERIC|nr:hypothetical protein RHGRI_028395 [Rhododendron griersonianum]
MDEYEILEDSMSLEQTHGIEIISQNFPVAVGSQKQSIRGKGFTMVEDEALCRAYLAISQDPIIGTNQTMANLWERLRLCFSSQADVDCNRTAVSLMKRWSKIQKAVSKFCGFLAQVERRQKSGTGEKEKMAEAKRMFSIDERNKSFMFESCWEILRHSCKWDEIMTPSQKPTVQTTTSSNPSTGTPISLESELDLDQQPSREGVNRPSGIKAALESRRKKVIDDVKFDQMAANQSQIINVLAGISSRGVVVIEWDRFGVLVEKPALHITTVRLLAATRPTSVAMAISSSLSSEEEEDDDEEESAEYLEGSIV